MNRIILAAGLATAVVVALSGGSFGRDRMHGGATVPESELSAIVDGSDAAADRLPASAVVVRPGAPGAVTVPGV